MAVPHWRLRAKSKESFTARSDAVGRLLEIGAPLGAVRRFLIEQHRMRSADIAEALGAPAVDLLLSSGLLRAWHDEASIRIWPRTPLDARRLRAVLAEGGYCARMGGRQAPIQLISVHKHVALLGPGVCSHCFSLRLHPQQAMDIAIRQEPPEAVMQAAVRELVQTLEAGAPPTGSTFVVYPGYEQFTAPVVPHVDCPRCGTRPAADAAWRALSKRKRAGSATARRAMVNGRFSPLEIQEEQQPNTFPFDVPFVYGAVRLSRRLGGNLVVKSTRAGVYGKGMDAETARLRALSEGVERLCALSARPSLPSKAPQLSPAAFGPRAEILCRGTRRRWVEGVDLHASRAIRLPLESVAVHLTPTDDPALAWTEPFYSGCASHLTFRNAILHATVELLERDAFMISWYRRRRLSELALPVRPSRLAEGYLSYLQQRGASVRVFDLRLDVPVPMLLARVTAGRQCNNWPRGGSMLFAAGGFSACRALERVLALACGQWINFAVVEELDHDPLNPKARKKMERRMPGWALTTRHLDPARAGELAFLDQGQAVPFESLDGGASEPPPHKQFTQMRTWLAAAGLSWYAVRLTDAAAEQAGFEVAKVVMPELVRLTNRRRDLDFQMERFRRPWPHGERGIRAETHPLY